VSGDQFQTAQVGDTVLLTFTFRNNSGTLTTPSTTTFKQRKPSQTTAESTTTTSGWTTASTGVQTRTVSLDESGLWRFEALGAGNSVDDLQYHSIEVFPSKVTA